MPGRIKGCFDTASKLRSHNPNILCQFLEQFPAVLKKFKIILPNPVDREAMPYDALRDALMSTDIPDDLTVLLILIGKLGTEQGWGEIEHEAGVRGVKLDFDKKDLSYSDRALMAWILAQPGNPDILEESFARSRIYSRSSYIYYPMSRDLRAKLKSPDASAISEIEAALDTYFRVDEALGAGAKVLVYDYGAEIWFLIRHPGMVRQQGVYDHGRVKSLPLTPEHYDAVIYHKKYGDLRINSHRKKEHLRYRIAFGHMLFGEMNVFDNTRKIVNLSPLIGDCAAVCDHRDIPGLKEVAISEVCFTTGLFNHRRVTYTAPNENSMLPLDRQNRVLPSDAETVIYAKFRYQLAGDTKYKTLTVHSGKAMSYERDGDSCVLEDWLRERKIIENNFSQSQ